MKKLVLLLLGLCLPFLRGSVFAQAVWSGTDFANSPNWSDVTNWAAQIAPSNGGTVTFTGATGTTPVMNNSYTLLSLTFGSGATASFTLTNINNSVLGIANGLTNSSTLPQTLAMPVTISNSGGSPLQWLTLNGAAVTTVAGPVSDQGNGLSVSGSGTLNLAGSNTFTGGVATASGSTMEIGGAGDLGDNGFGTGSYAGAITNNGAINFNSSALQTLSGTISGPGSLTVNGNGVAGQGQLTLTGSNTYTGITTINNDLVIIDPTAGDASLGAPPATFVYNQLTLNNNLDGGVNDFGLRDGGPNPSLITLSSNRGIFLGANGGSMQCAGGATLVVQGVISGTGPFYSGANHATGYGYLTLNAQNTYSGPTVIAAGWLILGVNNALPVGTPVTIGSSSQAVGYGAFLNMNGFNQTIGPLSSSTGIDGTGIGTPAVEFSAAGVTLTILQTNANTTFGGVIGYFVSNEGGNVVITVPSGGTGSTLTLNNTNTYTGTTTINMAPGAVRGPTLALASNPSPPSWGGAFGAISNSSAIIIGAGGTLDVSQLPSTTFNLSSATSLGAGGTGTSLGTTAAAINGASGGIVNLGSQPISLTFTPGTFSGDTAHPALYISQGTLSLNGNIFTVSNATATPLGAGTYLLIEQATGTIASSGSFPVNVTGSGLASGDTASIVVSGGAATLVVSAPGQTDVWNGGDFNNSPNWSDANNWVATAAPNPTGDNVFFAGTVGTVPVMNNNYSVNSLTFSNGAGSFTLANAGGTVLTVGAGVTNSSTNAQVLAMPVEMFPDGGPVLASQWSLPNTGGSITVESNLTDAGTGLIVSGPGPLTLAGSNFYSGPTTISAGSTLAIGGGSTLTSGVTTGTYASAITNNGVFNYNSTAAQTLSGIISGTGVLAQSGPGALTLSGVNVYTGITTISNGSLAISKDSDLGAVPATVVANQLYMNCNINPSGNTYNDYGLRVQSANFSLSTNRGITLGPLGGSINVQNTITLTVLGVISGIGPFYASPTDTAGYGTIILSNANTYTGATFIGAGTLELGVNNALPAGTPLTIGASGAGSTNGSFFIMNGHSQTIGPLSSSTGLGGTGLGIPTIALTGALTILQTNANTVFGGLIKSNGGSLTISVPNGGTAGVLTLTNTNSYTGPTTISGGTLALSNRGNVSNSSTITIGAGGTLDVSAYTTFTLSTTNTLSASGTGTTPGSTAATIKGGTTVSLGTRPVSLTFTPASVHGDTTHPALYVSQGALTLSGNTISVNNASGTPLRGGTYSLIQVAGGTVNGTPNSAVAVTGSGIAAGATASISVSSGSVNLVVVLSSPPSITSFGYSGGNFVFSGTNGPASSNYIVLMTTNVALPFTQWAPVSTNTFSGTGTFSVTNAAGGNTKAFFAIEVP